MEGHANNIKSNVGFSVSLRSGFQLTTFPVPPSSISVSLVDGI